MSTHEEFPALMPEAKGALKAGYAAAFPWHDGYKKDWTESNRKGQAAFLRQAMQQAADNDFFLSWKKLRAIAENLHSPPPSPPSPPTLAQAREADLESTAGRDLVRDFLATLGEWVQP
jgi:hypothetical protein